MLIIIKRKSIANHDPKVCLVGKLSSFSHPSLSPARTRPWPTFPPWCDGESARGSNWRGRQHGNSSARGRSRGKSERGRGGQGGQWGEKKINYQNPSLSSPFSYRGLARRGSNPLPAPPDPPQLRAGVRWRLPGGTERWEEQRHRSRFPKAASFSSFSFFFPFFSSFLNYFISFYFPVLFCFLLCSSPRRYYFEGSICFAWKLSQQFVEFPVESGGPFGE